MFAREIMTADPLSEIARNPDAEVPQQQAPAVISAKDFQLLAVHHEEVRKAEELEAKKRMMELHREQLNECINHHIADPDWHAMLQSARAAAEAGNQSFMVLRFPNELCSDGGRAINMGESGWTETLRGEAAEIHQRWQEELKPQGFHLMAKTLEYPGGFPGDIGLFLTW